MRRQSAKAGAALLMFALSANLLACATVIKTPAPVVTATSTRTPTLTTTPAPIRLTQAARPFPQHVSYSLGTIKPNHRTQEQLDDDVRAYYEGWKSRYLIQLPGDPPR